MIIQNLLRRKFRTAMFIVGISVILTGMQVLLGVTSGLDSQIEDQMRRDGIDIVVLDSNAAMIFNSAIRQELWDQIAAEPGVKRVYGATLILATTPKFPMLVVYGIEPDRFPNYRVLEGRLPEANHEVAIGKAIAPQFGAEVGGTINLFMSDLQVTGFYETGIETEDGAVLMTLRAAQRLAGREGRGEQPRHPGGERHPRGRVVGTPVGQIPAHLHNGQRLQPDPAEHPVHQRHRRRPHRAFRGKRVDYRLHLQPHYCPGAPRAKSPCSGRWAGAAGASSGSFWARRWCWRSSAPP